MLEISVISFLSLLFFFSILFPYEIMEFMELLHHGFYNISAQLKIFYISMLEFLGT